MNRRSLIRKDEEGVSPVIATILMVVITVVLAAVLYGMVSDCTTPSPIPIGFWCNEKVLSPTEATVEFGKMSREIRPTNLEFILIRNNTTEARYGFSSNYSEDLVLKNGSEIGTLTFENLKGNLCVNEGDRMRLTNLAPNSEYILKMIWAPSGDEMASVTFSTILE
ncbi:MAG: type IV pilin [Methanobacteriota archaeon]|nr:MAG: type IV pilin [Euryarchaeota archaeon]